MPSSGVRSVPNGPVAPKRLIKAFDQHSVVERFVQESDCSGAPHLRFDPSFGRRCHEDNRHRITAGNQLALQLDTTQPRHLEIGDQTRRPIDLFRLEKVLSRWERDGLEAKRAYEAQHSLADGGIIIDDGNHGAAQLLV
jgi:hypothetical protein